MDERIMCHWGIKGMKWGVRRYQNKDGSLTPAGKKRYSDSEVQPTEPSKKQPMTDDELRARISRLELEKRYNELMRQASPPDSSKRAKDFVTRVLEKSGENIATQLTTVLLGEGVNRTIGKLLGDENLVNPKKGQKDK